MTEEVSTPDAVGPRVADLVRGLAECAELTRGQAYRLRLAADEIATNIVEHGYGGRGVLVVCGGVDDDRVWVRTEDRAPPFDPRGHDASHVLATHPAERTAGGLGLHVAMAGLDEFHYERVDGRNRNTMVVCRAGRDPGGTGSERGTRGP
ncbi:ATP-binding protein [Saccharothrix hoggarensis]|uniref:ATP-binding protein n=1 Tax=Saccharothrix hoggarensis TaxID=913853 RepID=A0ABW3QQM9_9PSEU